MSGRSAPRRSAGTAYISEWRRAFTSVAPGKGGLVGPGQLADSQSPGHDQVGLGVTDQGLDHPFGLWVVALAEVRPKAVVQRKAHVGRRGHHDVGHDPALQAAHAVGQHHLGHRPQRLEAAGQHIQRRRRLLVGGKTHETPTGKRHNGTKDVQAGLGAPVDDEHLAGRPHARAPATVVARAPVPLGCGHQAPEVAGRAYVTASPGFWQQAFGRYAARGPGDPGGHHVGHDIEVVPAGGPRAVLGGAEHRPSHCLVVDAADGGGSPETAQVVIGSDDVHAFPLSLQWSVLRVVGAGWVPTPWPPGGQRLVDPQRGVGTSTWPRGGPRVGHTWGFSHGHGQALSLWWYGLPGPLLARRALGADIDVDVAVVGAGFSGLWAAYYLLRASPSLRVAVMEKEVAGFGASGRNGGWCSALFPASDARMARQFGPPRPELCGAPCSRRWMRSAGRPR